MEAILADAQLLFDFLLKGDNWLIAMVLGFALFGVIESLTGLFNSILPWNRTSNVHNCECDCQKQK